MNNIELTVCRWKKLPICWSFGLWIGLLASLASCRSPDPLDQPLPKPSSSDLNSEVTLKSDRESLSELRTEIPLEQQKRNDEEAKLLQWMGGEPDVSPEVIQERYSRWANKRRANFQADSQKLRDKYNSVERHNRDLFLKMLADERNKLSKRTSAARRDRFYQDQERRRKEFFAKEYDERTKFRSELREKQQDFESEMEEKRRRFLERWREYRDRYFDAKKQKEQSSKGG